MDNETKTHDEWASDKPKVESGFEGFLWMAALGLLFSGVWVLLLPLLYFAPKVPTAKYDRSLGNEPCNHSTNGDVSG